MLKDKRLNFSGILASSIHDMKNSLGMVLSSLDEIVDREAGECTCTPDQVGQLQYEAKRVNDNLIQLLSLYKLENGLYNANIEEIYVEEFLEESLLQVKPLLDFKGISGELDVDPDLMWYFDRQLMAGVIDNIVTNAVRYTRDRIVISATVKEDYLVLSINDNGPGFPEKMLGIDVTADDGIDMISGRTKLGLFFVSMVAAQHTNRGKEGYIRLENGDDGGSFSIYLP